MSREREVSERVRWMVVVALVLASACGGGLREVEPVGEPTTYVGQVIAARGPTVAQVGDRCEVEVQATDGSYLNCRIRIRCGEDRVYGLSGAGYNHCRRESEVFVFAHDHRGTRADGDPRVYFDLEVGRVIVSDDAPDVEVLIDLLRTR